MDSLINILDDEEIISNAKKSLENKGYFIIRNALTEQNYLSCREEALSFFKEKIFNLGKINYALRGDVAAGMHDNIGFEKNNSWHLYRYCSFKWNRTPSSISNIIRTSNILSRLRNIIINMEQNAGEFIEDNNYITYTSLSLYPKNGGFLNKHRDAHPTTDEPSVIHCKFELTHKGKDYSEGGFYIIDRQGKEINISEIAHPRDAILFDGTLFHEIKPIKGGDLGRIAVFDIPTFVTNSSRLSIYSGDGFSLPKKIITKILSNGSYFPKKIFQYFLNLVG